MAEQAEKPGKKIKKPKSRGHKIAGWLSVILWVVGFGLAFVIKPHTPLIWVPDALLLAGFFPLLYIWSPSWPWIIFGLLNLGIGWVLLIAFYLPPNELKPDMLKLRDHLADYHAPFTWMYVGVFSMVYGVVRMTKNIIRWSIRKAGKTPEISQPES